MGSSPSSRRNSAKVVISKESNIEIKNMEKYMEHQDQENEQKDAKKEDGSDSQDEEKGTSNPEDSEAAASSKKSKKTEEEHLEEWKPKFDEATQYLNECEDYTTEECYEQMADMFEASKKRVVRKALSKYVTEDLKFAELFIKVWHSLVTDDTYDIKNHKQAFTNLKRFKIIYWNFTDTSKELCFCLFKHHALLLLLKELENPLLGVEQIKSDSLRYQVKATMGILMNAIRHCDMCRAVYRKANAVEILLKYEASTYLIIKAKTLLLLSYIVDEHEGDSLTATDGSVEFILNMMREALKTSNHVAKTYGFGLEELLEGLMKLALLENNKVKIGIQGGIYLLYRVLSVGYSEEEQVLAAQLLWSLAFMDINVQLIKLCEKGTRTKSLKEFLHSEIPELMKACHGVLWEVFGGNRDMYCEMQSTLGETPSITAATSVSNTPHIMISYQWDVQQRMIDVRERLRQAGYVVWMDVEKLEGDLLVGMADAVEKAAVVLVCVSQKYKDSQNCRTEASYAYKQKKPIVPILVEADYTPDGWLGALTGMLKYFKIVTDEEVDTGLSPLVNEIGNRGKVGGKFTNGPIVPVKAATVSAPRPPTVSAPKPPPVSQDRPDGQGNVTKWTSNDVEKWMKSNDLTNIQSKLRSYSGKQLVQMYNHFQRAPDFFLNSLKNDLNMDYFTILNFTAALDNLFS